MSDLNTLVANSMYIITALLVIVSVLAMITTIVTQFTKTIGFLDRISTQLQVLATAEILCIAALLMAFDIFNFELQAFMFAGAIILGFVVASVSIGGWERMHELWQRYKPPKVEDFNKEE